MEEGWVVRWTCRDTQNWIGWCQQAIVSRLVSDCKHEGSQMIWPDMTFHGFTQISANLQGNKLVGWI